MQLKPDVEVIFRFVGNRRNRLYEGYRPAHLISADRLTTGVHSYYNLQNDTNKDIKGQLHLFLPNLIRHVYG